MNGCSFKLSARSATNHVTKTWGKERRYRPTAVRVFYTRPYAAANGLLHPPAALFPANSPRYPLNRRSLGRRQSWSGYFDNRKTRVPAGSWTKIPWRFSQLSTLCYVAKFSEAKIYHWSLRIVEFHENRECRFSTRVVPYSVAAFSVGPSHRSLSASRSVSLLLTCCVELRCSLEGSTEFRKTGLF
jgi:hypothetical protein